MNTAIKMMKSLISNKAGLLGLCISLTAGIASAEDIEIFQKDIIAENMSVNQQVLFSLDSSGSMSYGVAQVYDETFTVLDAYKKSDTVATTLTDIYIYNTDMTYTGKTVPFDNNVCKAMIDSLTATDSSHIYTDSVVQLTRASATSTSKYWNSDVATFNADVPTTISGRNDATNIIECELDKNIHGEADGDTRDNPKNETSPTDTCGNNCYQGNRSLNNYGQEYYFVHPDLHNHIQNSSANITSILELGPTMISEQDGGDYCNSFAFTDVREEIPFNLNKSGINSDENSADYVPPLFYDTGNNNELSFCLSKVNILREVMVDLVLTEGIDFGLMKFNGTGVGGSITGAIEERDATEISLLQQELAAFKTSGDTPLAETFYEAYLYLAGDNMDTPLVYEDSNDIPVVTTYGNSNLANITDPNAVLGTKYISPLDNQCQSTSVVMLTDGLPNNDDYADSKINTLAGNAAADLCSDGTNNCMPSLSGFMAETGIVIAATATEAEQNHFIRTYTVAFDLSDATAQTLLTETADEGIPASSSASPGDGFFVASNAEELKTAFEDILISVQDVENDTFAAPAVTVSSFNRLQFSDSLYFALFKPAATPRWNGNIKKYKLNAAGELIDRDNELVVDDTTGFFADDIRSFWSAVEDGSEVAAGGFASNLTSSNTIYIHDETNPISTTTFATSDDIGQVDLAGLGLGEAGVVAVELNANQASIVNWTLGEDPDDTDSTDGIDANFFTADSIHSTPLVIPYGTTVATPEEVVFATSNRGLLHAIDADTGGSLWSYIPSDDLLKNLGAYYNNNGSDHVYGLDGEMTTLIEYAATGGIDKAYLYFGQRRGGSNYFGVDVSNATGQTTGTDVVDDLWTIEGGIANGDFENMGQTWAKPVSAQINYCTSSLDSSCGLQEVVILSGGYDTQYDDVEFDTTTTVAGLGGSVKGNAIYIVAAEDNGSISGGDLLWMASDDVPTGIDGLDLNSMNHSFPAEPTAIDITGDGAVDLIFAVDIAGQVFRFDLKADGSDDNDIRSGSSTEVAGGIIADLSEASVDRLFYNGVDVALTEDTSNGGGLKYTLLTGSGHRAHPLDEEPAQNRMYVLFDKNIIEPKYDTNDDAIYTYTSSNATVDAGDLSAVTTTITQDVDGNDVANSNLDVESGGDHEYGYYIAMSGAFEKALSSPLIVDSQAFFTTYLPTAGVDACSTAVGSSNVYALDLVSGVYVAEALQKAGLSGEPVIVYVTKVNDEGVEENEPVIFIGPTPITPSPLLPELETLTAPRAVKTTWWEQDREN